MAVPQVELLHLRVALYLVGRAFSEDAPVVHQGDALGDAQGDVHGVLDDDEAHMRQQRLQDVDEVAPLAGRQSGGGLVEEDEARCAGQRQGDLQLALLAMAQLGDRLLTHRLQMDGGQQRLGGFHERSEEHTSELQSLMRISYAVFCLKKKTIQTHKNQLNLVAEW